MNDFAKVTDEHGLIRDQYSKAILSTDLEAKQKFMKEREQILSFSSIQAKIDLIQTDVVEIKTMLSAIAKMKCDFRI